MHTGLGRKQGDGVGLGEFRHPTAWKARGREVRNEALSGQFKENFLEDTEGALTWSFGNGVPPLKGSKWGVTLFFQQFYWDIIHIQFTHFKCTVQFSDFYYVQNCAVIPTMAFRTFPSPLKSPALFSSCFPFRPHLQPQAAVCFFSASTDLPASDSSNKWNHALYMVFGAAWLFFFFFPLSIMF